MRTANLAIVFTDIKGFTERTSRQTYEENERMLRIHDALLTPVFKAFGGRLVKTIGDAFLVVFESPTQAVLCGVAVQDRLWDYNRRVDPEQQIHVRVAANMGEVRLEKGDVFGEPVNIAARVEGLADAGEVLFTESIYLAMNKAEVPAEERGLFELKGIPEKVRVYRVPVGDYRLASSQPGQATVPDGQPPFGGLALARCGLPEPDPQSLQAGKGPIELVASLGQAAAVLASKAATNVFSLRVPRRAQVMGAVVAVGLVAGGLAFSGNEVESALGREDWKAARTLVGALPEGPERRFYRGRVEEGEKRFDDAAQHYARAFRDGERRGLKRLLRLTGHDTCGARAAAARTLGELKAGEALSALRDLEKSSFDDDPKAGGDGTVLGSLGSSLGLSCDSRQAATRAIQAIEAARK